MEKAREFVLKIFKYLKRPEMRILPGQLAFFLVITIIPITALMIGICAMLSISTENIRIAINQSIPPVLANILNSVIIGDGINFNMIIFYVSALLLASNGIYSMINISNEIYKVKPKAMVKRRSKAIIMTFIVVCLLFFLLLVPVFGKTISEIILQVTGSNKIILVLHEFLSILKYPIILGILYFSFKIIYVIAPDEEIPSYTTRQGAFFASVGWILATELFAFYLEKFAKYDLFYGSISNILVLLLWVYILSYIFVLGMIINASSYKEEIKPVEKIVKELNKEE